MTEFKKLTGYNENGFVTVDHVFIKGEGVFFETEELAIEHNSPALNQVGKFIDKRIIEGVEVYRQLHTNVWN